MIKIKVPATSANMGPGFDALGLAIDRYNVFGFKEGLGSIKEESLVHVAYNKVFKHLGKEPEPVLIEIDATIPMARGLGSSAACIVGGAMGANEVLGCPLSKKELLKIATEIEGHPDNVAPAIFGGMVVSVLNEEEIYEARVPVKNEYDYIVLVPDFKLSTEKARAVLPKMIPYGDGVFNVGRASLLVTAMVTGEDELIKIALEDKLHQSYRGDLIPGFINIMNHVTEFGVLGCYLSGAGPSIMCITRKDDKDALGKISGLISKEYPTWTIYQHSMENTGATRVEHK